MQSACAGVSVSVLTRARAAQRSNARAHRLQLASVLEQLKDRHALCCKRPGHNIISSRSVWPALCAAEPEALADGLHVVVHAAAALRARQQALHHHLRKLLRGGVGRVRRMVERYLLTA